MAHQESVLPVTGHAYRWIRHDVTLASVTNGSVCTYEAGGSGKSMGALLLQDVVLSFLNRDTEILPRIRNDQDCFWVSYVEPCGGEAGV